MSYLAIAILIIGIVLLSIEIFVPGFGIFGGLGILAMVIAIILTAHNLWQGIFMFLGMAVFLTTLFTFFIRFVSKKQLYGSLILRDVVQREKPEYDDMDYFIGKIGVAVTPLRPSGHVDFNGVRLDVLSSGSFIQTGRKVVVVKVYENKIIVDALDESKQSSNNKVQ